MAWKIFPGQGSQYVGMGKQLYDSEPVFREAVDHCAKILDSLLPTPLLEARSRVGWLDVASAEWKWEFLCLYGCRFRMIMPREVMYADSDQGLLNQCLGLRVVSACFEALKLLTTSDCRAPRS